MGFLEMSEDTAREFKQALVEETQNRVDGPVEAVGAYRRGGSAAKMVSSYAGLGAIVYAAISLFHKQKAGGLPERAIMVATPDKLYAFNLKIKGRSYKAGDEVGVWARSGLRCSSEVKSGVTMLTIESPAEGEKVTIAPIGVRDDPISLEMTKLLTSSHPTPSAAAAAMTQPAGTPPDPQPGPEG